MRCENYNQNPAVIEMKVQVNGKNQKWHLCRSCHAQSEFGGGSTFENFFKGLGMQPSAAFNAGEKDKQQGVHTQQGGQEKGLLEDLGRNLTQSAKAGEIDPVIGRDKEIRQVIKTFNKKLAPHSPSKSLI